MRDPNFTLLFIDNPEASAAFYAELLGRPPVEQSPTFAMFRLESGLMLGLWSKHTAEPAPAVTGGGCELGFPAEDRAAVETAHAAWRERGVPILQAPVDLDFGFTFVGLDPDGHRLRVFFPTGD